jgi:hypothetical protein
MKVFYSAVLGFAIQAVGLGAFIVVAGGSWASPGKQLAIGATVVLMALLLFAANRPYVFWRSVVISALLALGYLVAYILLGLTFFRGLLSNVPGGWFEYSQSIIRIFGLLFIIYLAGSAIAGKLNRFIFWRNKEVASSPYS